MPFWTKHVPARADNRTGVTFNMNDSPVRIDPEEAAIGRPAATARRLVEASVSPNTRRAYAGALRPARRLARRARARRRGAPSCTTRAAPRRAPRWRSPRRASARSWPGSMAGVESRVTAHSGRQGEGITATFPRQTIDM